MSWLDSLRGSDAAPSEASFPLGARIKGAVTIDALSFRLTGDAYGFACPEGPQIIEAVGTIDLGDGAMLHRLYLTDDAFLQIASTNGSVGDTTLFVYVDSTNPTDQAAFRAWVEEGSLLGASTFAFGGNTYQRVWGEGPDVRWTPPVVFDEKVYKHDARTMDYDLTLYSMLYERSVDAAERNELLLIAAEDSGPNTYCISYALGVPLTRADFEIT